MGYQISKHWMFRAAALTAWQSLDFMGKSAAVSAIADSIAGFVAWKAMDVYALHQQRELAD